MDFRITGLSREPFLPLFELSDAELAARGAQRRIADGPGFPCRVSLADAAAGERVLLLSYEHQPATNSPYRAHGPIFVREAATQRFDRVNEVPTSLRTHLLSLRAYDRNDCIVDAEVGEGTEAEALIARFLGRGEVAYLHAHYARFGCYACRIDRV